MLFLDLKPIKSWTRDENEHLLDSASKIIWVNYVYSITNTHLCGQWPFRVQTDSYSSRFKVLKNREIVTEYCLVVLFSFIYHPSFFYFHIKQQVHYLNTPLIANWHIPSQLQYTFSINSYSEMLLSSLRQNILYFSRPTRYLQIYNSHSSFSL